MPPRLIQWPTWQESLQRFADATGLVVSMFDETAERRLGPFASTRFAQALVDPALTKHGAARDFERELAVRALAGETAQDLFDGQLRVHALPLRHGEVAGGAIVYGWVFADFATSMGVERLARHAGVPGRKLWSLARLESPLSTARMATHAALLSTIVDSGMRLRDAIDGLEQLALVREGFLAHVSHDLRTPLSSIAMRLELLLDSELDDVAKIRKSLEAMVQSVKHESRLIEDLLEAAVTRTGQFTVHKDMTDLSAIARAACDAIAPMAVARNIRLVFVADGAPLWLLADAPRIQQVLWNLISNAVKFTPEGGLIEVRTGTAGATHSVQVIDDGPGIPSDQLPLIFEPFARTSSSNRKGLGLGLSIARQIVELHGGSIHAASTQEPRHTTFTVVLPSAEPQPRTAAPAPTPAS